MSGAVGRQAPTGAAAHCHQRKLVDAGYLPRRRAPQGRQAFHHDGILPPLRGSICSGAGIHGLTPMAVLYRPCGAIQPEASRLPADPRCEMWAKENPPGEGENGEGNGGTVWQEGRVCEGSGQAGKPVLRRPVLRWEGPHAKGAVKDRDRSIRPVVNGNDRAGYFGLRDIRRPRMRPLQRTSPVHARADAVTHGYDRD